MLNDLLLILFLVFLEGILSIDNALVLALLAKKLPKEKRKKALTYGLLGAIGFRLLALLLIRELLQWHWIKFIGGGYLVLTSGRHFFQKSSQEVKHPVLKPRLSFWRVVLAIELTDVAFALDSILAAIALTSKFWVIFTGGVLGIIMMRFAANLFINILDKFPSLENTAYLLVLLIGIKVSLEGFEITGLDFQSPSAPAFWIFWILVGLTILYGFIDKAEKKK